MSLGPLERKCFLQCFPTKDFLLNQMSFLITHAKQTLERTSIMVAEGRGRLVLLLMTQIIRWSVSFRTVAFKGQKLVPGPDHASTLENVSFEAHPFENLQ